MKNKLKTTWDHFKAKTQAKWKRRADHFKTNYVAWIDSVRNWRDNFSSWKIASDFLFKWLVRFFFLFTILAILLLVGFVAYKASYFIEQYGLHQFFTTSKWSSGTNTFGVLQILVSSVVILFFALLFSVPLTIFASLYICEYLPTNLKRKLITIIRLLAGIPSVVFGLFALSILGAFFQKNFNAPSRYNLIITSITLAFMGGPIMMSLAVNAIDNVPQSYRFNAHALGLSKTYTTFRVVYPHARAGIIGAIILGIARIIGETMAVLMISGNNAGDLHFNNGFLKFIFSAVASLASTIGLEMLDNTGMLHESGLYTLGLVLFLLITVINLIVLGLQSKRYRRLNWRRNRTFTMSQTNTDTHQLMNKKMTKQAKWRKANSIIAYCFFLSSTLIVVFFTLAVLISILVRGFFEANFSDFISTNANPQPNGDLNAGILACFLTSLLLIVGTMLFAIPLALVTAICLSEYANPRAWPTKVTQFILNVMSSTPSIIYGMFGLFLFITLFHLPLSVLAASLTLTFVILPMMIRNMEDAFKSVSPELKRAAMALGVSKMNAIFSVSMRKAMPGISTAVILGISRTLGESAPVYLTLGTAVILPGAGFLSPGSSLTTEILTLWKSGLNSNSYQLMYEIAFVIMVMILLFNWLANYITYRYSAEYTKLSFVAKIKISLKNYKFYAQQWMHRYGWETKKGLTTNANK